MSAVANAEFKFMNYKYVVSPNIDFTEDDCLFIDDEDCILPNVFTRKIYVERFREVLSLAFSNEREQMTCKIAELKTSFDKESIEVEDLILHIGKRMKEGGSYGGVIWKVIWTNTDRVEMLEVLFELNLANRFLNDLVKYVKLQEEIRKATEATLLAKTRLPEDVIRSEILSYM